MNPNGQCRLCNCSFKVKFGNSNISTENFFNPSQRKGCKGEILAQNLQRAGFEVVKSDSQIGSSVIAGDQNKQGKVFDLRQSN